LIPFAALHDGKHFVVENFGIVVAPGLTVTDPSDRQKTSGKVLLAGVSQPGPVLGKLPKPAVEAFSTQKIRVATRGVRADGNLDLPGVKEEINALKSQTGGDVLLNEQFTVERFRTDVSTGRYRILHIASHAMFSRSAETSFIMAFDDILTLDDLQKLLRSDELQVNPIEMLTFSACQTAEGDDRAPIGIAGAVLRARANSAIGSLWPVADSATKVLMVHFYELLTTKGMSKSKALQRAQIQLAGDSAFKHPFYWAPFILVGSWQ
jgi:CHAT domain-containing protein